MAEEQQQLGGEFAAIVNGSRDLDQAAEDIVTGPKSASEIAAEVVDPVEAWAEIPATVGGILSMALPELKSVYSPKACTQWGKAMHKLAVKRGWSADGLPAEVAVGLASAMFVVPTAVAIKVRRDAAARAKAQAEGAGALPEGEGAAP